MALHGVDVSRHQGTVDFVALRNAGNQFCIIKGTDGTSYSYISWFRTHFPRLRSSGMVPGVYHFLNKENGYAQAQYFVREVNALGGFKGVLAVVDVEKDWDGTYPSITTVRAFAQEFKRLVPNHPLIVYTGKWFWVGYLGNPKGNDIGPLWHSEYETSQAEINDGPEADSYGGWSGATIWQYTSTPIDKNLFYGDLAALRRLADGTSVPTAPQEEEDVPHYAYITGPGKPPRVFVDGSLVGFPNTTELNEFLAPYKKAGYKQVNVAFAEADDWDRYMAGVSAQTWAFPVASFATVHGTAADLLRKASQPSASAQQIAEAVAAQLPETLPDGSLTVDAVEEAVKQALREGVGA